MSQAVNQTGKRATLKTMGSKRGSKVATISKIDSSSFENDDGKMVVDEDDDEDQDMDDMVADETESRPSLNSNSHIESAAKLTGVVRHSESG